PPRAPLIPYTTLFRSLGPCDAREIGRQLGKIPLDGRQNLRRMPDHRNVDLTTFDVLLDQRWIVKFVVNVLHALHQLFDAVHDGLDRKSTRLNSSHVAS